MRTIRTSVAVLAAAIAVAALPAASAGKPKRVMFKVWLRGGVQTQFTDVERGQDVDGLTPPTYPTCLYDSGAFAVETRRFTASARLRPNPRPVPMRAHDTILFRMRLSGASASASSQKTGQWNSTATTDDDPNCTVVGGTQDRPCAFLPAATHGPGAVFALWVGSGSTISYGGRKPLVRCDGFGDSPAMLLPEQEGAGFITIRPRLPIDLHSLAVGQSVSRSDSWTKRFGDGYELNGQVSLRYKLKVKRVR